MAIVLTAPAMTENDTIVVVMTDDQNLVGLSNSDFMLFRADTDVELSSVISVSRRGSDFIWDITVTKSVVYSGAAYLQMAAESARELDTLREVPPNDLNSNVFRFVSAPTMAPDLQAEFVDGNKIRLTFTASDGEPTHYEYKYSTSEAGLDSVSWISTTNVELMIDVSVGQGHVLSFDTFYFFQVRAVNSVGASPVSNVSSAGTYSPIDDIGHVYFISGTDIMFEIGISDKIQNGARLRGSWKGLYLDLDLDRNIVFLKGNIENPVFDQNVSVLVDGSSKGSFLYSVVPPVPIIDRSLDPLLIMPGAFFDFMIPVQNVEFADVMGDLIGLDHEVLLEDHAVRVFGMVPADARIVLEKKRGSFWVIVDHPVFPKQSGRFDFFLHDDFSVFLPATPTGFIATPMSDRSVRLSWNAVPGVDGYEISVDFGSWRDVGIALQIDVRSIYFDDVPLPLNPIEDFEHPNFFQSGMSYTFYVRSILDDVPSRSSEGVVAVVN